MMPKSRSSDSIGGWRHARINVRAHAFRKNIMLSLFKSITFMRFDRLDQNAS
jgi:hypothetical protein